MTIADDDFNSAAEALPREITDEEDVRAHYAEAARAAAKQAWAEAQRAITTNRENRSRRIVFAGDALQKALANASHDMQVRIAGTANNNNLRACTMRRLATDDRASAAVNAVVSAMRELVRAHDGNLQEAQACLSKVLGVYFSNKIPDCCTITVQPDGDPFFTIHW